MSRRTRLEYRETNPLSRRKTPPPKAGFLDWMKREIKRRAIAAGHIADPSTEKSWWEWEYLVVNPNPTRTDGEWTSIAGFVKAETKSEVRAILKRELKMKLPPKPYTRIEKA